MKCPECLEVIKEKVLFCPYCGYKLKIKDNLDKKDIKIQELEEKVAELKSQPTTKKDYFSSIEDPSNKHSLNYKSKQKQQQVRSTKLIGRIIIFLCVFSIILIILLISLASNFLFPYY
ncbi:MAG: hypothetical protein KGD63_02805 [Candidatus Lokiarchaeota archaeon]|nr:hypothetical protein [Candidatus Lokiarchaeota archaeon]